MSCTISVIIPVYNVFRYLPECVKSVLAQSHSDLEVILVDDGSVDGSGLVCDQYAAADSRVQVIHQKNGGPSAARNAGLDIATGDFVMFCDSDDVVSPIWCEKLFLEIQKYPDAFICCGFNRIQESGDVISEHRVKNGEYEKKQYYLLYLPGLAGSVCNKIYSRKIIQANKLRFDTSRKYAEDVIFNLEYLELTSKIVVIEDCLYDYYMYTSHDTASSNVTFFQLKEIYSIRLKYIAPEYMDEFRKSFWFTAWSKFLESLDSKFMHKEAKKIVQDEVFQELLEEHGKHMFDKRAFVLLKQKCVGMYCILQYLGYLKRVCKEKIVGK